MIDISWSNLKTLIDSGSIEYKHVELDSRYEVYGFDKDFKTRTFITKGSSDATEYEASYKTTGESKLPTIKTDIVNQPPFAKPDYRTKRDATSSWETVNNNTTKIIDFVISEERYVTGGEIIYKNAQEGDYISAEVYDKDGVIPQAYRASLCENHPTVSEYIVKKWIEPTESGKYGSFLIDTYPLNAKITVGLYLRVTYVAANGTGDRKVAINYHLSKKLV